MAIGLIPAIYDLVNRMKSPTMPFDSWYGMGIDGDVTISADTTIGTRGEMTVKHYNSLTVNSGITLTCVGTVVIYVRNTLTLNGTIDGTGGGKASRGTPTIHATQNTPGRGGSGGGCVAVVAKKITGSGTIQSNGVAGGSATTDADRDLANYNYTVAGSDGVGGSIRLYSLDDNVGPDVYGNGDVATTVTDIDQRNNEIHTTFVTYDLHESPAPTDTWFEGSAGASGAAGGTNPSTSTSNRYRPGGGGAGGTYFDNAGNGGSYGYVDGSNYTIYYAGNGSGGGGGGSGGVVFVACPDIASTIKVYAQGGNGGNGGPGYRDTTSSNNYVMGGGGGGGGSGGIVLLYTNVEPTVSVTGGSAGTGGATSIYGSLTGTPVNGRPGTAGSSGCYLWVKVG